VSLHTRSLVRNSKDNDPDDEGPCPSVADRLQLDALERDLAAAEADNAALRLRLARVEVRLSRLESALFAGDGGEGVS
jgi:hypothetical protein